MDDVTEARSKCQVLQNSKTDSTVKANWNLFRFYAILLHGWDYVRRHKKGPSPSTWEAHSIRKIHTRTYVHTCVHMCMYINKYIHVFVFFLFILYGHVSYFKNIMPWHLRYFVSFSFYNERRRVFNLVLLPVSFWWTKKRKRCGGGENQ